MCQPPVAHFQSCHAIVSDHDRNHRTGFALASASPLTFGLAVQNHLVAVNPTALGRITGVILYDAGCEFGVANGINLPAVKSAMLIDPSGDIGVYRHINRIIANELPPKDRPHDAHPADGHDTTTLTVDRR